MKKLVIFDLDGTLLNSISAIANAVNKALKKLNLKEYEEKDYNYFVGGGLRQLVSFIGSKEGYNLEIEEKIMKSLMETYSVEYDYELYTYDGIKRLLRHLDEKDIKYAVVTNKDTKLAIKSCECDDLKEFNFYKIVGVDPLKLEERKPNPINVLKIMEELNVKKEDTLFVGDMIVDLKTAMNSGVDFVYCNWGFGNYKQEEGIPEDVKVNSVDEIIERYL